jgi:5-methylcytosine-specific restriction endonuclease McrA
VADHNYKTTEAHRARSKQYYEANKERCAQQMHERYLEHREHKRAYDKEYYARTKAPLKPHLTKAPLKPRLTPQEALERKREALERKRERCRAWRESHPDAASRNSQEWRKKNRAKIVAEREMRAAQARAYRAANLEKSLEKERQWKKNNPEKIRSYIRNRKARLASRGGKHTAEDIQELYRLQQGQCVGCNALLQKSGPEKFHVDHIVPLFPKDGSKPGSNGPENLQLLCPRCNLSKSNLSQERWDRNEGRLL